MTLKNLSSKMYDYMSPSCLMFVMCLSTWIIICCPSKYIYKPVIVLNFESCRASTNVWQDIQLHYILLLLIFLFLIVVIVVI